MQNIITKIFWVIGYSIIGSCIGLLLGIGILMLQDSGVFVFWKPLDNSFKFTQIDPIFSNASNIIATSEEGKTYLWVCNRKNRCDWVKAVQTFDIKNDNLHRKGSSCQFSGNLPPKAPPAGVNECVFKLWIAGEGSGVDYYALLDDGKVWHWGESHDAFGDIFFTSIWMKIGATLGALTEIFFIYRKEKQKIS